MPDFAGLIDRLERAERPSRELDGEVNRARFPQREWRQFNGVWCYAWDVGWIDPPRYTSSLDAALMMIPNEWQWEIGSTQDEGHFARVWLDGEKRRSFSVSSGVPHHALMLCAVVLKVRQSDA